MNLLKFFRCKRNPANFHENPELDNLLLYTYDREYKYRFLEAGGGRVCSGIGSAPLYDSIINKN